MTSRNKTTAFGSRVYGLGVMAFGIIGLTWRNFVPGQPVPRGFPGRTALACAAAALMLLAGAAVEWRRTAAWGAAALTAYYALAVVVLMNGRLLLTHYADFLTYDGIAEQLSIAAGALIVYAASAQIRSALALRLAHLGRLAFGICALVFGAAHFVYLNFTASLVPKWLPPTQHFWACATGIGFLAAGVALLTGVQARFVAILLTVMLACFGLLVNGPILFADHSLRDNWSESAINLAITGVAWVVADSLARQRR
ncbi:MAG: DoxX family membrane protein [Acidobacteriaceae bacterium]|jgi:uncharacterized membrane protein YphA (DoxX/SURF4 family)